MQAVEDELKKNKGSFVISSSAAGLKPAGSSMAYCEYNRRIGGKSGHDTALNLAICKERESG